MENTLFGSGSTKLTSGVVSEGFNLDTGLYEAMYEQSQMQLKIFEAMIKADSLSRKYRAQGIYSESTIQAFNEEAKFKIGDAILHLVEKIKTKVGEWWKAFKTWATDTLRAIKMRFSGKYRIKNKAAIKASKERDAKRKADANAPMKALPAPASPVQKAMKALPAPGIPSDGKYHQKIDGEAKPATGEVIAAKGKSIDPSTIEVEWPKAAQNWSDVMNEFYDIVLRQSPDELAGIVRVIKGDTIDPNSIYNRLDTILKKHMDDLHIERFEFESVTKKLTDIPELKNGVIDKLIDDKTTDLNKCDKLIDEIKKVYDSIASEVRTYRDGSKEAGADVSVYYMHYVQGLSKNMNAFLTKLRGIAKEELVCYTKAAGEASKVYLGEMADLVAEAAVYEVFMSTESYAKDYDLYSAEGIKRFAAARLEAAMDEISDVIDNAINSDNAQGIEDVNRASTEVLGAGVSNDPNKLTYDDDCYSQEYDFGDENIAGTVDANIVGTSTNVASGNETKAAVESFFFNW